MHREHNGQLRSFACASASGREIRVTLQRRFEQSLIGIGQNHYKSPYVSRPLLPTIWRISPREKYSFSSLSKSTFDEKRVGLKKNLPSQYSSKIIRECTFKSLTRVKRRECFVSRRIEMQDLIFLLLDSLLLTLNPPSSTSLSSRNLPKYLSEEKYIYICWKDWRKVSSCPSVSSRARRRSYNFQVVPVRGVRGFESRSEEKHFPSKLERGQLSVGEMKEQWQVWRKATENLSTRNEFLGPRNGVAVSQII